LLFKYPLQGAFDATAFTSYDAYITKRALSEWRGLLNTDELAGHTAPKDWLFAHMSSVIEHAAARGDDRIVCGMTIVQGQDRLRQGDSTAAAADSAVTIAAAQRLNDPLCLAISYDLAARVAIYQGDLAHAETLAREGLSSRLDDQHQGQRLLSQARLASILSEQGRHAEVLRFLEPVVRQIAQGQFPLRHRMSHSCFRFTAHVSLRPALSTRA
jgi:hypothetical protein